MLKNMIQDCAEFNKNSTIKYSKIKLFSDLKRGVMTSNLNENLNLFLIMYGNENKNNNFSFDN